ncbi:unnamed protein product [Protopolystoma xenopodis]|uniref:Uncharacterized protein n=1 Tax=Protopolystoma xenopodis TaxID=117903 RepID=A0A3S5CFX7_9PLAT|nr:unnamed protein product [Protopolystoma xenopodis]
MNSSYGRHWAGLLGVGSGSNFPDIIGPGNSLFGTACCNSSQQRRNGEVFSSNSSRIGYPSGRDTGALDSSVSINGPASLLSAVSASFGNLTGDPHRGFSEPLSNLSSATGSGQSNRKSDASIEALARAVALIQKAEFAHLSIRAPSTAIPNSGGGLNLDPLEFPPILPSSGRKVTGPNSSASPPVTKTRSYVYHLSKGLASGGMDNASSGSVHPPHLSDYCTNHSLCFDFLKYVAYFVYFFQSLIYLNSASSPSPYEYECYESAGQAATTNHFTEYPPKRFAYSSGGFY